MRYLSNREDFLRKAKRANTKSDFLKEKNIGIELYHELIKESEYATNHGAGPMTNDIPWNDSLVGRLINHMIRKAKVAYNLGRIQLVIARLKSEFDRLAAEGHLYKLGKEEKMLLTKAILSQFFEALKDAVEKGYKVEVIKNLTDDAIAKVEDISEEDIEEETRRKLIDELEEFKKFLEQFKDDEGEEDPSLAEEDEDDDDLDDSEDGILTGNDAEKLTPSFPTMVSNLNSLYGILVTYKSTVLSNKGAAGAKSVYKVQPGDTLTKVQANKQANKKNLDIPTIKKKNPSVAAIGENDDLLKKNIKELVLESYITEDRAVSDEKIKAAEKDQKIAGGRTANVVDKNPSYQAKTGKMETSHASQALVKLQAAIKALVSDDKGVAIDAEFVKALIDNAKNTESKNLIKSLYNEINVCLKGERKATIQDPDPLYKEGFEYLRPRTAENKNGGKIFVVAEKIARFAKRAMQFDGENLYGELADLGKHLQKFVETMKQNMKAEIVKESPKQAQPKKEEGEKKPANEAVSLKSYGRFVGMISEAEDTEASDPPTGSTAEKIQDFFDRKCLTVKEYVMEKTEYEKVRANVEKISKEKGALVIEGFDPVIEIMKLFNKAYKLYMSDFISKRSNGPGVGTMMEYDKLGDGYRNKKIFNQWESAVLDIMKDRKYQQIFSPNTKLRVGEEMREKAGANLRKFMTEMLDGDKLYGGGSGEGTQAKLLNKYFGEPDEEAKNAEKTGFASTKEEFDENRKRAENVMKSAMKLKPKKMDGQRMKKMSFFVIKGKDGEGNDIQRSFFVQDFDGNNNAYLQYSSNFFDFNRYLSKIEGKREIEDGDIQLNRRTASKIKYTKVKKDLVDIMTKPGKIKISYFDDQKNLGEEEIQIDSVYWLTSEDENKKAAIYEVPKEQKKAMTDGIKSSGGISNIIYLLSGEEKVNVSRA